MTNLSNKDKTRLCLIICLGSINIEQNYSILSNTALRFENLTKTNCYNNLKKQSQSFYIKSLSTLRNILDSSNQRYEKNKIISILKHYSSKKRYSNLEFNSIFSKYIDRFTYKYIKYYKYNFINQDYKKNKSINKISLIYLYLLYKTLQTNKKFYIYKHLKLKRYKLKTKLKF